MRNFKEKHTKNLFAHDYSSDNLYMKRVYILILTFFMANVIFAGELSLVPEDLVVLRGDSQGISETGSGIHLFVRKKDGMESVLLAETTKDPEGQEDNYAYRAGEYNSINGDEIRYLNGQVLVSQYAKYSLVSSTVEYRDDLGECFHIYIPPVMEYGYPWSRNGTVKVGRGTFINIRTFEKKYADYTGDFKDNPFMFDFAPVSPVQPESQESPENQVVLTADYSPIAAEQFARIASDGNGLLTYSRGPESLSQELHDLLDNIEDKSVVDIVFALDTTGSMKDDLEMLKKQWIPDLMAQMQDFEDLRIGLVLYRDYTDNYLYRNLPVKCFDFTYNVNQFYSSLKSIVIDGTEGGDEPEAVYEALYAGMNFYGWRQEAVKKIILIGDAEPHSRPRGTAKKITREMVISQACEEGIQLDCIIVPNKI